MEEQKNKIETKGNEVISKSNEPQSFFSENDIKVILQKLREDTSKIDRNLLLDYLRATTPTTIYRISKETKFAYTSLKAIIREFEFVGLISFHVKVNDNNQAIKEIHMEEKNEF
jgi:hypothetical protein|tara:strand:- start:4713 stop:5054 length:342 start_codon:yes stop_codon:yes gene_type:complete